MADDKDKHRGPSYDLEDILAEYGSGKYQKAPSKTVVEFPAEELKAKLLAAFPEADLSGGMEGWLKDPAADSAGNVGTVSVGGVAAKGTQVRAALGLRSACFTWEAQKGGMAFFVTGYGHGVGLSQYGASAMAAAGAGYREILTHYYTGVTVEPYQG